MILSHASLRTLVLLIAPKKPYHITISLKPYTGGKARFVPELWALSIYVASPVTSPANSTTLIYVNRQPATCFLLTATMVMLAIPVLPV